MQLYMSCFMAFVFVFPAYLIWVQVTGTKELMNIAKEKAISRGHVVTAKRYKMSSLIDDAPGLYPGPKHCAWYKYEYNGKTYKYRHWDQWPPMEITLYFIDNPRKATTPGNLNDSKIKWPLIYAIVVGFMYLIIRNGNI